MKKQLILEDKITQQNGGKLKKVTRSKIQTKKFLTNKLWETRKYYAKNDLMLLNDHLDLEIPKDKFKDMRDFTKKVVPVQDKITQIINFPGYKRPSDMTPEKKDHSNYNFTSKDFMFRTKNINKRLYDDYPPIEDSLRDFDPVFTSFPRFVSQNSSMVEMNSGVSPLSLKLNRKESLTRTRNTENKSSAIKRTMFDSLSGIQKMKQADAIFNVAKKVSFEPKGKFVSAPGSPLGSMTTSPVKMQYEDTAGMSTKVSFKDATNHGIRSSGFN